MARSRNIKPGFFVNEDLLACDPLARILFAGLWCHSDRDGRMEDRPRRMKIEILPMDDCDIDVLLQQLVTHGFIVRYEIGSARYIQVLAFKKHQTPHQKEQASTIPAPDIPEASPRQARGKPEASPGNSGTCPALTLNPLPESLNPHPSSDGARVEDSEKWIKVGSRCLTILGKSGDPTWNFGIVRQWLQDGADPENHIYPVLVAAVASGRAETVRSLKYFSSQIAEAKEGLKNGKPHANGGVQHEGPKGPLPKIVRPEARVVGDD
jgi:hypothetical protein